MFAVTRWRPSGQEASSLFIGLTKTNPNLVVGVKNVKNVTCQQVKNGPEKLKRSSMLS